MKKTILILLFLAFVKLASAQQTVESANKDTVYTKVEKMATFAGPGTFLDFIIRNTRYPAYAYKNRIEGKVLIRFKVNTDGQVAEAIVIKPVSAELDSEAVRVTRLSKWYPAIQNSRPIACYITIPFDFRIPKSTPSN